MNNGYYEAPGAFQNQPYYRQPLPPELRGQNNVGICLLLYFVTCGIYFYYWAYQLTKKTRALAGDTNDFTLEYVLLILCPFYYIYWLYTRGKTIAARAPVYGVSVSDNSIIYLICSIFGVSIIAYAIMQNDFNTIAASQAS